VRVVLTTDCIGVLPSFTAKTTCIDAARLDGAMQDGILDDALESVVGTWPGAIERPCLTPAPDDAICVPGGYSILGDPGASGLDYDLEEAIPLRPVRVDAFHMDRTEFTVARFRSLMADGFVPPELPVDASGCTWRETPGVTENFPLNCVTKATAQAACAAAKGALPSEAQFSHVAHGRGEGRSHSWGEAPAVCCRAVFGRVALLGEPPCGIEGFEPPASLTGEDCEGIGDVSRDGVVDLAGNMGELVRDDLAPYSADCWKGKGPLDNRICEVDELVRVGARGGNWFRGSALTLAAVRYEGRVEPSIGFRCVYEAE
jgi:formylglycine-generating enzyme required for sulfatase activity